MGRNVDKYKWLVITEWITGIVACFIGAIIFFVVGTNNMKAYTSSPISFNNIDSESQLSMYSHVVVYNYIVIDDFLVDNNIYYVVKCYSNNGLIYLVYTGTDDIYEENPIEGYVVEIKYELKNTIESELQKGGYNASIYSWMIIDNRMWRACYILFAVFVGIDVLLIVCFFRVMKRNRLI